MNKKENLILTKDQKIYHNMVVDILKNKTNLDLIDINKKIIYTTYYQMLTEDSSFVTHYSPEYWVNDIIKEI